MFLFAKFEGNCRKIKNKFVISSAYMYMITFFFVFRCDLQGFYNFKVKVEIYSIIHVAYLFFSFFY